MSDVQCPYCKTEQEINHDDGYGYEEDGEHEQECYECEKTFEFTTAIYFSYNVYCQGGHRLDGGTMVSGSVMYRCEDCDQYEFDRPLIN